MVDGDGVLEDVVGGPTRYMAQAGWERTLGQAAAAAAEARAFSAGLLGVAATASLADGRMTAMK